MSICEHLSLYRAHRRIPPAKHGASHVHSPTALLSPTRLADPNVPRMNKSLQLSLLPNNGTMRLSRPVTMPAVMDRIDRAKTISRTGMAPPMSLTSTAEQLKMKLAARIQKRPLSQKALQSRERGKMGVLVWHIEICSVPSVHGQLPRPLWHHAAEPRQHA